MIANLGKRRNRRKSIEGAHDQLVEVVPEWQHPLLGYTEHDDHEVQVVPGPVLLESGSFSACFEARWHERSSSHRGAQCGRKARRRTPPRRSPRPPSRGAWGSPAPTTSRWRSERSPTWAEWSDSHPQALSSCCSRKWGAASRRGRSAPRSVGASAPAPGAPSAACGRRQRLYTTKLHPQHPQAPQAVQMDGGVARGQEWQ